MTWPGGGRSFQFRGRRVQEAMLDRLLSQHGLGRATDVLVTGDSAGGVAALNSAGPMLRRIAPLTPRWDVG